MWTGCANGLYRVQQSRLVPQLDEAEKPFEKIFCIAEDSDENLWLGTSEGMSQLRRKPFQSITRDDGLSHGNIASLVEDGGGNIWMGSVGGGLNCLGAANKQILIFDRGKELCDSVFAIAPRLGGGLWIGGERTLFRFSAAGAIDYTPALDLLACNILALLEDATGILWLSTCNGLRSFEKGVERHYGAGEGMPGERVRSIIEDSEGALWFGHENGLTQRKNGRFTTSTTRDGLSTNSILSLYSDANRDLWIGTAGGGLCRFHNGVIRSYGVRDGLPSDAILEVIEDGFDNLWMTTVRGVFRVRKGDLDKFDRGDISRISCLGFGKNDGMPSSQCSSVAKPAAMKSKDGRLWFATSRGVAVVDPSRFQKPTPPPKIVIADVIADGTRLEAQTSSSASIPILPGRGEIEFQFAALSFQAPEKNRFRYKLEPADHEWNDSGTRAVAHYNNLRPRTYTFRVQGCNSEGIWNETGASVALILLPHFWETTWFMGAIVAASILLVAAIARYLTWGRVRQKLAELQSQHALERERSRIAQDMHDDLGSRLTEILLVTDNIQQCKSHPERVGTQAQRVANVAREVADNLDALVWTVNPSNDSLPKLLIYLREFANNFVEPTAIRLRFDTPMEVPEIPLSSELRHNLLLAMKEALNNAVKYAECSEIRLSLQVESHQCVVAIEDNGKGFSPEDVAGSGNGLHNMEKRMRHVGGTFTLRSAPEKGTQIQLSIPLPG
ncbi:MAG: putative two-component system sensor kinase [Verrucomicrobiales bacterium]|nr:putative two-component system sensor kinase [Verrucomicrobiales bacterium]